MIITESTLENRNSDFLHSITDRSMNANGTNASFVADQLSSTRSFLNTIQLVTSALTPFLELSRIILSVVTFLLVHYSPLYRTTSFGLHIRCLAIYDACRIIERLFYWFPPLSLFMPK